MDFKTYYVKLAHALQTWLRQRLMIAMLRLFLKGQLGLL